MADGTSSSATEQETHSVTVQKPAEAGTSSTNEEGPSSTRQEARQQKTVTFNQRGAVALFTNKRGTGFADTIIHKLGFDKFLFCVICQKLSGHGYQLSCIDRHLICLSCLKQTKAYYILCPVCDKVFIASMLIKSPIRVY